MRRLSAAAMAWAGYVPPRDPNGGTGTPGAVLLLVCVALVFGCWRLHQPTVAPVPPPEHVCAPENPWGLEVRDLDTSGEQIYRLRKGTAADLVEISQGLGSGATNLADIEIKE